MSHEASTRQESLVSAINDNDIEQLKELLETITDVEKSNAVIYSAYMGKMEPLELLIEAGAVLDRPDTEGHTALYWAKERDHPGMIHLLHQQGVREEHISATTMELLKTVGLKQVDLTALGIKLEDLERSVNPRFLGQCLRFLVSVSLIKTFMLWPFMQRGGIKLDQEGEAEAQSIRPRKNKRERPSFSDVSESEDARLLSANEFNDTEEESEPDDDIVIKDEADTDDKNERRDQAVILEEEVESHLAEERKHKRKTCSAPVFTSSALLFESEPILKTVAAINAFHETVDTLISSVWNAFLSSLIINGLINYALYPEERGESDLLDAFGITGLRNFGCITSIKTIKDSFLCSSSYKKGYEDVLSYSLSSYYIWPFIAGIPVLFGVINAIRASWNMKALDKQGVKALIQQLKEYKPGFWADGLGWIFTAAIPDLFPPAAILFMLPQPAIKNALEKIRQTIIWDGRLSAKDRQKLFNHLNRFAQQRSQFTQMKALSMLADIVDGINFKNLAILEGEGVDDETIKTLTIIKTKALKELEFLANHYHLPDAPKSLFRPLFRYIYANYLMWNLGYPQQGFLQPLFFAAKALKLYYTLLFYKAVIGGVIETVNDYLEKKQCLEAGNEWTHFKILDEWKCTVCEDFSINYRDIFRAEDCVRAYFEKKVSFNDIMNNIIYRGNQNNSWGISRELILSKINSLNLIEEKIAFKKGELALLLHKLKPKMTNLRNLNIEGDYSNRDNSVFNSTDIEAIAHFVKDSGIEDLRVASLCNGNDLIYALGLILPRTNIKKLWVKIPWCQYNYGYIGNLSSLSKGLKNSRITHLYFLGNWGENAINNFAQALPFTKIVELGFIPSSEIRNNDIFIKNLLNSSIQSLQIHGSQYGSNEVTYPELFPRTIVCSLNHIKRDFNLSLDATPQILGIFTDIFLGNHFIPLRKLHLNIRDDGKYPSLFCCYNETAHFAFLEAIAKTQIVDFSFSVDSLYKFNHTKSKIKLLDIIERSKISNYPFDVGDYDLEILDLFTSLLDKLRHRLQLASLRLYFNARDTKKLEAQKNLLKILPHISLQALYLSLPSSLFFNNTVVLFAEALSNMRIKKLDLKLYRIINFTDILPIMNVLNQTQIEFLEIIDGSVDGEKVPDASVIKTLFSCFESSPVKELKLNVSPLKAKTIMTITEIFNAHKFRPELWINKANIAKSKSIQVVGPNIINNLTRLAFPMSSQNDEYYTFERYEAIRGICETRTYIKFEPLERFEEAYDALYCLSMRDSPFLNISLNPKYKEIPLYDFCIWDNESYTFDGEYNPCCVSTCAEFLYLTEPFSNSGSNHLLPNTPYIIFYQFVKKAQQLFYTALYEENKILIDKAMLKSLINNIIYENDFQSINLLNLSNYVDTDTIIVDLKFRQLEESYTDDKISPILPSALAVKGCITCNNYLIGSEENLLDVSQSRRINFLLAGKNNKLRLGFFSQDHVVIQEGQGTIQIQGFESKDTLHLVAQTTVYGEANIPICQNEIIENDIEAAVIHLKGTTVQLFNMHCENIENNIKINDPESMDEAQREVLNPAENHQSVLYTSLLSICETFLGAVHKSALFTAVPVFVAEILYRSGGYTRAETEKFSEEIQKFLVLSFADNPHVMAASFLAGWLATKLTHSPHMISTISIGASIVASVAGTALSDNVSLSWMALQTGVALMGSVVGSYSVRWGLNKASEAKAYLHNKLNFWFHQPERDSGQAYHYDTNSTIAYR